jgi:hypothetical protein
MAHIPDNAGIRPTPASQEAFWALQDEYLAFCEESRAIKARHKQDWDDQNARFDAWNNRFAAFNSAHAGQEFQIYRPEDAPRVTAVQWARTIDPLERT